jgi:hypothetical protein
MRLELQEQSELKFVSRIIPQAERRVVTSWNLLVELSGACRIGIQRNRQAPQPLVSGKSLTQKQKEDSLHKLN